MGYLNVGYARALLLLVSLFVLLPTGHAQTSGAMLDEMTVTARRREESLQDTPISVSAFSGDRLEAQGITKINRLQDLTPNLVFQNTPSNSGVGTNAAVFIRGIGQKDFAPTTEPGVGIYVDGVYLARAVGSVFDMIDIERVEVLRGPQGTLFGRNTIGGAISLTTIKPNEELSGKIDVKVGTDSRTNVRAAVNIPLVKNIFMRASGGIFKQDGYVDRPFDGKDLGDQDNLNARLAFRWLATEKLEFNLALDYNEDKTNGHAFLITRVDTPDLTPDSFVTGHNAFASETFNPFDCFAPDAPEACYNEKIVTGNDTNLGSGDSFSDIDTQGAALTIDWRGDYVSVKSITAVRNIDGTFAADTDGGHQEIGVLLTPDPNGPTRAHINQLLDTYEQDQFSQELHLYGNLFDDHLNWLVGVYYFEEDGENLNPVDFFPVSLQSGGFFDYNSKAVFAQVTYEFSFPLSITAGLRYTEDDRDYLPDQFIEELPLGPLGFPCFEPDFHIPCEIGDRVVPFETVNNSIEETTPHLNIAYRFSDNIMSYISYSEGYKGGGFTQRIFPPEESLPGFEPEFAKTYEIGAKMDLLDGRMRLNGAVFYTDYTDLQLLVSDASRIGPFVTNAGDATMQGFELELDWIPAEDWRIDFGVGYLDAEYDSLTPGAIDAGLTLDSPFVLISDWNLNASVAKGFHFSNASTLTPRIDWVWRSEFYTNSNGIPFRPGIAPPLFQPDPTAFLSVPVSRRLFSSRIITF